MPRRRTRDPVELRVEMSLTRSNARSDGDPTTNLRIEEPESGEVLAEVTLTPAQVVSLLAGTSLRANGYYTAHPERLGHRMAVRQVDIPREVTRPGSRSGAEAEEKARTYARSLALSDETVEVRSSNSGWKAIFRSWPVEGALT